MSIERDDLVDITIRRVRVFDFVRDNAWAQRLTVLSHDGTKWFLVADKSDVVIELHEPPMVDSKDWLDPNRATGDSTDSTDAKVFGADKALGGSVACTYGCFGGNNDFDCPVHGGMQGGGRDV